MEEILSCSGDEERERHSNKPEEADTSSMEEEEETLHPSKQDVLKWQKKHLESAKKKRQTWRLK